MILGTQTPELLREAVQQAAALLRAGEVVALPTETVYGLAADATNAQAVEKLFQVKGRPLRNPIIVHVSSLEMARKCAAAWPKLADKLAQSFWPGPLTLVLPRAESIPDIVTAGGATVAVRWPSHPVIQAVIAECGFPIAAPSANLFGHISPTTAEHVRKSLGKRIALILDGGPSQVGIESTVLDLTVSPPQVLRPGMIHADSLRAVTGTLGHPGGESGPKLKSPGQMPKHYAPQSPLLILSWQSETELQAQLEGRGFKSSDVFVLAHTRIPVGGFRGLSVLPHAPAALARAIYAELHRADEAQPKCIVMEELPQTPEWHALADRLQRASV